MSAPDRAEEVVLGWARTYTRGLRPDTRGRRLGELASDCHEQRRWGREVGAPPVAVAASMVARTLAGMPADLLWRQQAVATSRDRSPDPRGAVVGRWMRNNWWVALAVLVGALEIVMGVGLPFEDGTTGALVGGVVIALLGLGMLAGVVVRRRHRARGDVMIAVGTFPMYWLLWTIVLPLAGLAVLIPAVLDAADARAVGDAPADDPAGAPGSSTRIDRVSEVLLALTVVAIVVAVLVARQDVAFAVVSPVVTVLVAHALLRRASFDHLVRAGLTGVVASVLHGLASVTMLAFADAGVFLPGEGPGYVATSLMGSVGVGGIVLVVVGVVRSRDRARPA